IALVYVAGKKYHPGQLLAAYLPRRFARRTVEEALEGGTVPFELSAHLVKVNRPNRAIEPGEAGDASRSCLKPPHDAVLVPNRNHESNQSHQGGYNEPKSQSTQKHVRVIQTQSDYSCQTHAQRDTAQHRLGDRIRSLHSWRSKNTDVGDHVKSVRLITDLAHLAVERLGRQVVCGLERLPAQVLPGVSIEHVNRNGFAGHRVMPHHCLGRMEFCP